MNRSPLPNPERQAHPDEVSITQRQAQEIHQLEQEITRLQGRSSLLLGLLFFIILASGGAAAWFSTRLQSLEQQQAQQAAPQLSPEMVERLQDLEKQVQTIAQRLPTSLEQELQTNQARLQELAEQFQQFRSIVPELLDTVSEPSQQSPQEDATRQSPDDAPSPISP